MARLSLRIGSTLMMIGLIAFSFGMLIMLHQSIILENLMSNISDIGFVEVIGILLQFFGIALAVTGLIMSISVIIDIKLESERRSLFEFKTGIEKAFNALVSRIEEAQIPQASPTQTKTCKYCGAKLVEEEVFCPSCGRSQE